MSRWSDDKLGLWLVGAPLVCTVVAAVGMAQHSGAGGMVFMAGLLLMMLVTYVVAGMDATRRGQTASILILLAWGIGYPLHMRSRQRYPGNYFGLRSGLLVLACWIVLIYIAAKIASTRPLG
jgi:hypothetical protein